MHDDQIRITIDQAIALVNDQLPSLRGLDIVAVDGGGTVNAIFRVGGSVGVRFPLRSADPDEVRSYLEHEALAIAEFARASPFPAPQPLFIGDPGHEFPLPWFAQTWLEGGPATSGCHEESDGLAHHDRWMEECIRASERLLDTSAMRRMWTTFRALPREDPDVMCHTDLTPSNILVVGGRLVGVLDTGGFQPADPALDLVGAWHLLDHQRRELLRRELECSDLQWERGRAWAFEQAAGAYWYYQHTNPEMAEMGKTTLERLMADR
jgi:aminoglycoside phosphotransferase (APT) family kinase protein